ncbi:MAG: DUF134 domain-containing protein [Bacteroidetes bacterium]|nr:DUF134 domain-containing protein [Bacteroidota bacterium]
MARPKNQRLVGSPPKMQGFKPFGIPKTPIEPLTLLFEEYESIKLLDYENLTQEEAAQKMSVSRQTMTRIYEKARKTIARAFVEGKPILIEGGDFQMQNDWYRCGKCHKLFQGLESHEKCALCPLYGNDELVQIQSKSGKNIQSLI